MTNGEAIKRLKEAKGTIQPFLYVDEVIDYAIKTLEQQSCEDCVSRQAVIELAEKGVLVSNGNYKSVCTAINELPSVNTQPKTDALDKIRAEIAEFEEEVFHRTEDYSDYAAVRHCVEIIDKYRAESEE